MSHWNYRVVKTWRDQEYYDFTIHEVYYDDNGNISHWSGVVPAYGENLGSFKEDLAMMHLATEKPYLVLYYDEDTGRENLVEEQ